MSLKLLELQVAIPRTMELGKIQEQQNQRATIQQQHINDEQRYKQEQDKIRLSETEDMKHKLISQEDESSSHSKQAFHHRGKTEWASSDVKEESHPYKGKHIDITL